MPFPPCVYRVLTLPLFSLIAIAPVQAQILPALDGTGTIITTDGNRNDISGGRLAGTNLFHSFQEFNLSPEQIANFLANPETHNILSRVVGGNPSIIDGLLQVTGSNAHFYLMNPTGIVFGSNTRLDVPGSFTATTATGIGFEGGWFNAIGSNDYAALTGAPDQFAFDNSQPGSIVNFGHLSVPAGGALTLLGGTTINTGTLDAPGGSITVASIPGENLVRISQTGMLLSLEIVPIGNSSNRADRVAASPLAARSLPALLTSGPLTHTPKASLDPI